MKSKSILLDKRICVYIIFIIISIIVLNSKKNYHVDELYSYSLANHDGDLNIEIEDGKEYEPADSPFISHLTLSPKNILNYEMVWENQIRDVHPPLYYCLVHFVSSFTPNYFTKWTAGIINIIFGILILHIVNKILSIFIKDETVNYIVLLSFAISAGYLSAVSFLRMYIMSMFVNSGMCYIFLRGLDEDYKYKKFLLYSCIFAILGALTHYYCIIFCVCISTIYVLIILIQKKYTKCFCFSACMMLSGFVSYLIFPDMLNHMFKGYRGTQSIDNLKDMSTFLMGIKSFGNNIDTYVWGGVGKYLIILIMFLLIINHKKIAEFKNSINISRLILLVLPTLFTFLFISKAAVYQVGRYVHPIYALSYLAIVVLIYVMLKEVLNSNEELINTLISIMLVIIIVGSWNNCIWEDLHLKNVTMQSELEKYKGEDCICIYKQNWQIMPMFVESKYYNSIKFVNVNNYNLLQEIKKEIKNNRYVLVLMGVDNKDEIINNFVDDKENLKMIGEYSYGSSYYIEPDKNIFEDNSYEINSAELIQGEDNELELICKGALRRDYSECSIEEYLINNEYIGCKLNIDDISKYSILTFKGKKIKDHGEPTICIYDENKKLLLKFSKKYEQIDNNWNNYSIDVSNLDGRATIIINGGYIDYTGNEDSEYVFREIDLQ